MENEKIIPLEINKEWKDFGSFTGKEFLEGKIEKRPWLIEKILKEKDSIIIVGNEKSGKSLLAFQIICSLTSQEDLFDKYPVSKPCKVTYVQLEGERGDSQDRLIRMVKALHINPDLLHYMFYPPLELHDCIWAQRFVKTIQLVHTPDVLIIDPVYFAFRGSLSDDDIVRRFVGNLRIVKEILGCAIVLIHHTHKTKYTSDGYKMEEGDEALFGSKFLKAWADHITLFMYDSKRGVRTMSCTTQRSGDIEKECVLKLNEPDPLYFEEFIEEPTKELQIYALLKIPKYSNGLVATDVCEILRLQRGDFYRSVRKLISQGLVCKIRNGKEVLFFVNKEVKVDTTSTQQLIDNS